MIPSYFQAKSHREGRNKSLFAMEDMFRRYSTNDQLGIQLPHLTQLSLLAPNEQSEQMLAGKVLLPIQLPHLTQLSLLVPKEQFEQMQAGKRLFPIQLPHLTQLSFFEPNEQSEQSYAL
jgi:hypothetical protein